VGPPQERGLGRSPHLPPPDAGVDNAVGGIEMCLSKNDINECCWSIQQASKFGLDVLVPPVGTGNTTVGTSAYSFYTLPIDGSSTSWPQTYSHVCGADSSRVSPTTRSSILANQSDRNMGLSARHFKELSVVRQSTIRACSSD